MKSFIELVQEIKKAFDKDDNSVLHNINSNIEETSTAQFPHNVGTQLIYNKTLYDVISAISVNDTLEVGVNIIESPSITNQLGNKVPTYSNTPAAWDTTPTASSTKPVTSDGIKTALDGTEDEISDIVNILSSKNLLLNTLTTQVIDGITFTVDKNGVITMNGTANNPNYDTSAMLVQRTSFECIIKNGTYKVSGSDAFSNSVYMKVVCTKNGSAYELANCTGPEDVEFTINGDDTYTDRASIGVTLFVTRGTTVTNAKVYPMIRPASIIDDTYVPYTSRLTVVNIPYSQFTWNSNDSSFIANVSHLPSTPIGYFVTTTNGNAIMGVRRYSSSEIRVFGWIPLSGRSITSDYAFTCYAVLKV